MEIGAEAKPENIYIKKITNQYEIHFEGTCLDFWFYLKKEDLINLRDKINEIIEIKNECINSRKDG